MLSKIIFIFVLFFSFSSYADINTSTNESLLEYRLNVMEQNYKNVEKNIDKKKELEYSIEYLKKQYNELLLKNQEMSKNQTKVYEDIVQNNHQLYSQQLNTFNVILTVIGVIFLLIAFFGFKEIKNKIDEKVTKHIKEKSELLLDSVDKRLRLLVQTNIEKLTPDDQKIVDLINEKLADKKDKTSDDWFFIGLEEQNNKNYNKAIEAYTKVDDQNINASDAQNNLGNVYGKVGQYDNALKAYEKSIKLNKNNRAPYNNKGHIYGKMKEFDLAYLAYIETINKFPNYIDPYINLFELSLLIDKEIDAQIIEVFESQFKSNIGYFMMYEMIKILKLIKEKKDYANELDQWKKEYSNIPINFGWGFDELDYLIEKEKDTDVKKNLMEAVSLLKNK